MEIGKEQKAYAFYSFIDEATDIRCGATPNTFSVFYPNPITKHKATVNLIKYALKNYFGVDIPNLSFQDIIAKGRCIDGIYCSSTVFLRAVGITVGTFPTGISINIPYTEPNESEYATHNFCENELKEYQKREYGDMTYFYLYNRKRAFRNKHDLLYEKPKKIDSTPQTVYTVHTDTFFHGAGDERKYYFTATDDVEFVKVDAIEFLP